MGPYVLWFFVTLTVSNDYHNRMAFQRREYAIPSVHATRQACEDARTAMIEARNIAPHVGEQTYFFPCVIWGKEEKP